MAGFGGSTGVSKGYVDGAIAQSTANLIAYYSIDISGTAINTQSNGKYYAEIDISSTIGDRWIMSVGWVSGTVYDVHYRITFSRKKIILVADSAVTVGSNRQLEVYAL